MTLYSPRFWQPYKKNVNPFIYVAIIFGPPSNILCNYTYDVLVLYIHSHWIHIIWTYTVPSCQLLWKADYLQFCSFWDWCIYLILIWKSKLMVLLMFWKTWSLSWTNRSDEKISQHHISLTCNNDAEVIIWYLCKAQFLVAWKSCPIAFESHDFISLYTFFYQP
jgi:hypothetical protein